MTRLDMPRILAASERIDPVFRTTPQYVCDGLSARLGCRVVLKLETANPVRCFKGRGTELVLSRLAESAAPQQAVCASAGNLGQALAWSGRRRGMVITVTASDQASPVKVDRMRSLGADVILVDGEIEAALEAAVAHAQRTGAFLVEDSKNIDTCEGAAGIGVELWELPEPPECVLISLGAGAMATGVGFAVKHRWPKTEVICVQPRQAPAMTRSFHAGRVVPAERPETIADGVAGRYSIPEVLSDLRQIADDAVLVREDSIMGAMRLLCLHSGLIVEPAAALGVAAIIENRARFAGRRVVTVLCGGNLSRADFERWTGGDH